MDIPFGLFWRKAIMLPAKVTRQHAGNRGELDDHASVVAALKRVDVVISGVGHSAIVDGQLKLIESIKEVGHIKRFLPSEYGASVDIYPPNKESILDYVLAPKRAIRKALREAGVPHTFICCGGFGGWIWAPLAQLEITANSNIQPPREKVTILGDGEGLGTVAYLLAKRSIGFVVKVICRVT